MYTLILLHSVLHVVTPFHPEKNYWLKWNSNIYYICTSANDFLQLLPQIKVTKRGSLQNLRTFLEKTTTKAFIAYLHYTWLAGSEGKGLHLIYIGICRIYHSTWLKVGAQELLNERINDCRQCSLLIKHLKMVTSASVWNRSYQYTNEANLSLFW